MTNKRSAPVVPWMRRLPALLAFVLPLALYVATLAPGLLNDDSGEYQLILGALGVAHPTGYPLYTLLGHLFTRLVPFGEIAWRVNLFSAGAGALACLALYALLRELGVARGIALFAALLFAVSADAWFYATVAQTYALNSCLIALVLLAFARWQKRRDAQSFGILGLAAGLGTAHHSTFWLVLPALALGVGWVLVQLRRERGRLAPLGGWRGVAVGAALFLLPLSLYLYIPIRGEQLLVAMPGNLLGIPQAVVGGMLTPHYLPGWTNVVMGSFYAGSTVEGAMVDWRLATGLYLGVLVMNLPGTFMLVFGVLLPRLWTQHGATLAMLLLAWLVNAIIVTRGVAAFGEAPGGLYTPTFMFGIIVAALVTQLLYERAIPNSGDMFIMLMSAALFGSLTWFSARSDTVAELHGAKHYLPLDFKSYAAWAESVLNADMPPAAVILGAWSQVTPLHYTQIMEQRRPDVSVLHAPVESPAGRDFALKVVNSGLPLRLVEPNYLVLDIPVATYPAGTVRMTKSFGEELAFEGFRAGSVLWNQGGDSEFPSRRAISLYFRASRQLQTDYKVFVHCNIGDVLRPCAPDTTLGGTFWTTSHWEPGQLYEHQAVLSKSDQSFEIGIYHSDTLKRLQLPDGSTTVRIQWR